MKKGRYNSLLFGVVIGDDGSSFVALGSVDLIDVSVVVVVSGVCEVSIFAILI
jgi:hypothetical protein